MGRLRHGGYEILRVRREAESGEAIVEVYRKQGISQQSFDLWKKKYAVWAEGSQGIATAATRTRT